MRARRFTIVFLLLFGATLGACRSDQQAEETLPRAVDTVAPPTTEGTSASTVLAITAPDVATTPIPTGSTPIVSSTAVATTAPPSTDPATTETTAAPTTTEAAPTTTTIAVDPATGVPVVDAAAYAVFDMRSGQMLASSEADTRRPVGSLIKLLAAHVGYSAGQPTRMVTAPNDLVLYPGDESIAGISPGQQFSRDTLIRAMLKISANDAARMLAIDIAGSEVAYAGLMNANAAALGLANTNAVNVTGLDAEGQYSSADDLVRLGVTMMGGITFQQTVKEDSATLNGQAFPNTNDLLGVYPGADGIKTGHTTGAGWCILGSAMRDGRRIVAAVLGAPTEAARDRAATALLDYGFAQP